MTLTDRIEQSPLWWTGRLLIPGSWRRAACIARGEHRLELADLGRTKVCGGCGTGLQ